MNREMLANILITHEVLRIEYQSDVGFIHWCACRKGYPSAYAWAEHVTDAIYPR